MDPMKDKSSRKRSKRRKRLKNISSEIRVEDTAWLCTLSESEIDMLISLKLLIIQRAKMIGYGELVNKFDLKMIRAIALVLMENLKAEVKDSSLIPDTVESSAFLDSCNLLKCDNDVAPTAEEPSKHVGPEIQTFVKRRKKRKARSIE